jgi:hypothetical protein
LTGLHGLIRSNQPFGLFSVPAPLFDLLAGSSAGFFLFHREAAGAPFPKELPMSAEPGGAAYLVCVNYWQYNDEGGYNLMGDEPQTAFRDRARAEAHRLELEWQARKELGHPNPVRYPLDHDWCSDEDYLRISTTLDEETLVRRLAERGLPVPGPRDGQPGRHYDWLYGTWWEDVLRRLPEAEWPWLWELFDRVQFYEVVEVPLGSLGGPLG